MVAFRACAFDCKVTKSRNVIGITVDVQSSFTTEVQTVQTILDASKNL
jgi:hypothetical protein